MQKAPFEDFMAMAAQKAPASADLKRPTFAKRRLFELLLGTLIIAGGQQFLYANAFAVMIWPITGVSIAMLFLRGQQMTIAIFIGCIAAGLIQHWPLVANIVSALCFSLCGWLSYRLSLKWIGPVQPIPKVSVLAKWISILFITHFGLSLSLVALVLQPYQVDIPGAQKLTLLAMNGLLPLAPLALMLDPFTMQKSTIKSRRWVFSSLVIIALFFSLAFSLPQFLMFWFAGLIVLSTIFAWMAGNVRTGFYLLAIATITLGAPQHVWFENPISPILFLLNNLMALSVATLSSQLKQGKCCE